MTADQEKSVIERISERKADIFKAEQKVADFILANPEEAVQLNVSEIAHASDVSEATVIRFCKHVGFRGYNHMRISLSRDLGRRYYFAVDPTSTSADSEFRNFFKVIAANMLKIGDMIDRQALQDAAEVIRGASLVHVVAVGNTNPVAQYMSYRLNRLNVRSFAGFSPEYSLMQIHLSQPGDVILAISQSGCSRQVVNALTLGKERGLPIVAITAHRYSPVSNLCDYLLLASSGDDHQYYFKSYSHLNEMAVGDALLSCLINQETLNRSENDKIELNMADSKL